MPDRRSLLPLCCLLLGLSLAAIFVKAPRAAAAPLAQVYYVDSDATGAATGLSWTDAFTTVQDALAAAASGDEIWVAEGVYYPDEGSGQTNNDRNATFQLKNGVTIYGGFAGTETALEQRDLQANVTVLSGDVDNNDGVDANGVVTNPANIAGNNAYHVVNGSGTDGSARLNGFTITAGHSNAGLAQGGGLINSSGSPSLANLTFRGNKATDGGGIYNFSSAPSLSNVTFSNNSAHQGAGVYNFSSSPTLLDVVFSHNEADNYGGGMYNRTGSSPTLTNVAFIGNTAGSYGGGIYTNSGSPTLSNISFQGNLALTGGGYYSSKSSPTLTNVTFSGNRATTTGGGITNFGGNLTLQNSILWNNQDSNGVYTTTASIFLISGSVSVRHTLAQACKPDGVWESGCGADGGNNLADTDPLFVAPVDPATAPTVAGDLRL